MLGKPSVAFSLTAALERRYKYCRWFEYSNAQNLLEAGSQILWRHMCQNIIKEMDWKTSETRNTESSMIPLKSENYRFC